MGGLKFDPFFKTKEGYIEARDISQKKILKELAKVAAYIPNNTQLKIQDILDLQEEELAKAF